MAKNKVSAPKSAGKQGGSAGTTANVIKQVNDSLSSTKGKLDTKESKFITNMIAQAAKTGKGISIAELDVIKREAVKQANLKDKAGVAAFKTQNIGKYIEDYKLKLSPAKETSGTVVSSFGGSNISSTDIITVTGDSSSNKIPNKDNVVSLDRGTNDVSEITFLVFEKLGAIELTKFTRHDTVDGINPYYNIISNLSAIKKEYDPSNLVSSQKSNDSLFNAFSIKLENKIPGDEYLEDRGLDSYVYIDENGSIIIELINITPDELVEIEIDTNGTIVEVR
jgi:hypothetical protein